MDSPESLYYWSSKHLTYRDFFAIQNFVNLMPTLGFLGMTSIVFAYIARTSSAVGKGLIHQKGAKTNQIAPSSLQLLSCATALGFFGIVAFYFSMLYGYRVIPIQYCYTGAIIAFSLYGTIFRNTLLGSKAMMVFSLLVAGLVVLTGPVLLGGICQAYLFFENGTYDYLFTTSFTRQLNLPEACPIGRPCHVYATLPENSSDSVFINYHTNIIHKESNTCYLLDSEGSETCFKTKVIAFDGVEKIGQRSVHSAYLYDMLPDTLYTIRIYYDDRLQSEEKYHTLPVDTSKKNVTIVMGGDAGFTELAYKTGKQAAEYKPDVIVLGGDIAYDNGMDTCYYAWDQFLGIFEYMNQVKGSLIPFIFSIGNHDSGVESLSLRTMIQDAYGPPYYTFFPQHSQIGLNGEILREVPEIKDRLSYSYHIVGGSLQLNLDSGYVAGYSGTQLEWMRNLTNTYSALPKFAYYHVPVYWVTGLWDPVAAGIVQGMQYWIPEFDRSKFMSVWENHSHLMKRTKPLKGGTPHENGTIYLGEGCWGALCYGLPLENSTGIFESYASGINHFWLVQQGKHGVSYTAIDVNGAQIDILHQNYETYGVKL